MTDTRSVVEAFFGFRAKNDIDGLLTLIAEDADFHAFGDPGIPWLGSYTGPSGAAEFFGLLFKGITDTGTEVDAMLVDGEEAAVFGRVRVNVNAVDKPYESPFALRLTVRDGKIVRHHVFEDSYGLHEVWRRG